MVTNETRRVRNEALLTAERLRELMHYDPDTGVFSWRTTGAGRKPERAGTLDVRGWTRIKIGSVRYRAARLAWLYMTGSWPEGLVDHRNRIRNDDRWFNLRLATHRSNATNAKKTRRVQVGLPAGVCLDHNGSYRAKHAGKHIGVFKTPQMAAEAYRAHIRKLHGDDFHYDADHAVAAT